MFCEYGLSYYICSPITEKLSTISSISNVNDSVAQLVEHLPFKERVLGSSPSRITKNVRALSSVGSEHLPYKQGVTGSNPVGPTFI